MWLLMSHVSNVQAWKQEKLKISAMLEYLNLKELMMM